MTRNEYDIAIGQIWRHLGGQFGMPKIGTLDSWYEDVRSIPSEAVGWIVQRIKRECDSVPRNLSRKLREYWGIWQREHADRMTMDTTTQHCAECRGSGVILFDLPDLAAANKMRSYAAGCARCDNWRNIWGERPVLVTIAAIEDRGGVVPHKQTKRSWEPQPISDIARHALPR